MRRGSGMPIRSGLPQAPPLPRNWSTTCLRHWVVSDRSKYRCFPESRRRWNSGFPLSCFGCARHRQTCPDRIRRTRAAIMSIPLFQKARIGAYVVRQQVHGRKRYPLVLMLEPLFRCNLACAGCGKIDYPDEILNQRLSVAECLDAVDECGAPVVSIAGGEPLLHRELSQVVKGILARRKFVYLCTNALLMQKKLDQYQPSPFFVWSVHLDGDKEMHDRSVCQTGGYDRAVAAIGAARQRGFRVNINCTLFNNVDPQQAAAFFDKTRDLGVDAITVSPGYAYERAPDQ